MDQERLISFSKENILALVIAGIGLVLVLLGLIQVFQNSSKNSRLILEEGEKEEQISEIMVDVGGAVINPGVYSLPSSARTVDALAAAGGISGNADRDWVDKNLNLAKKVTDGLKIYVPRTGEQILSNSASSQVSQGGSAAGPVINVNTASKSELETLSGVGPVTADKIINGRPYSDIEDLRISKIVGNAVFEKIKDKISAN